MRRVQLVGAALGLLLALLVCARADAIRLVAPSIPHHVWVSDAVAEDAVADALDMADHGDVTCRGYGRHPKGQPRLHRHFDCIIIDASNASWWDVRYRMTRWDGPVQNNR